MLCCKDIRATPKIRVLASGTLFQALDLENITSHISSVAVESLEAGDKIPVYIDQHHVVRPQQLTLV